MLDKLRVMLVIVTALIGFSILCPTMHAEDLPKKSQSDAKELIAQIANPETAPEQRLESYQALFTMPPEVRKSALLQLQKLDGNEYSSMAMQELIRSFPEESNKVAGELLASLHSMTDSDLMIVLGAIAVQTPIDEVFFPIARKVVLQEADTAKAQAVSESESPTAMSLGIEILGESTSPDDRAVLMDMLKNNPSEPSLWWNIGSASSDRSILNLAKRVYQDKQAPIVGRVAASTSIAHADNNALKFAVEAVSKFIGKFGKQDAMALARSDQPPGKTYRDLQAEVQLLRALYLLPAEDAQGLTFAALNSKNAVLHLHAAPAAALRWPDQFLSFAATRLEFSQPAFLAAVIYFHPDREQEVKQLFPEARIEAFLDTLKKNGPKMLSPFVDVGVMREKS